MRVGPLLSRKSVIAAIIPPALLGPFYIWIGAICIFVGRPPSVDYLPLWLKRWDFVGLPLLFLLPPAALLVALICAGLLLFRRWRAPAIAFLVSSATVFVFLGWVDFGGWFRWFMD